MENHYPVPMNEVFRQSVLDRLAILDTGAEESLDRITSLAAAFFGVPICLVSLIDRDRQWFKSRYGLDVAQTPRDEAFCAHAVMQDDLLVIEDAHSDPRFSDAALVLGPPYIRFYAGAPLVLEGGARVGTLCIIDQSPVPGFDHEMRHKLRQYADIVQEQLQARLDTTDRARGSAADLDRVSAESRKAKARFLRLVSHELRTPLTAVIGFADLMSMKAGHGQKVDVESYAEMISSGARTLLAHVDHLLSITHLERGELQLHESTLMLNQVLDASIQLLKAEAALGNHVIEWTVGTGSDVTMLADEGFLRQIIMHVLSHAIANATAPATIRLSVDRPDKAVVINVDFRTHAAIAVTTNALLDPFETAIDPMFANDEGLGVVLYIARLLAEAHGGTVTAHEGVNGSTRLSILLPAFRVLGAGGEVARA